MNSDININFYAGNVIINFREVGEMVSMFVKTVSRGKVSEAFSGHSTKQISLLFKQSSMPASIASSLFFIRYKSMW
jgi:hypothetical protein